MNRTVGLCVAVAMVICGGSILAFGLKQSWFSKTNWGSSSEKDPTAVLEKELTEFELMDQNGDKFSSTDLNGKVWLGSFFFASCEGPCGTQNRRLKVMMTDFADKGLEIVSITCDPARDTPGKLRTYSSRYDADASNWHFLTHSNFDYIKQVANDFFNLALARLTHSDQVVLFDRKGEAVGTYSITKADGFSTLHAEITRLLEEQPVELSDVAPGAGNPLVESES